MPRVVRTSKLPSPEVTLRVIPITLAFFQSVAPRSLAQVMKPTMALLGSTNPSVEQKLAAKDVVAAQLREPAADFVASNEAHIFQFHRDLLFVVRAQVGDVLFVGCTKKVSLGTVIARIAQPLLEARIETGSSKATSGC